MTIEEMKTFYREEKKQWEKRTALAEIRTKNTMKRNSRKLKDDLYILGFGIFNLNPNEITGTQIENFKYCIHDMFDELLKLGLLGDDEIRM